MIEIVPAIIAKDFEELENKIKKVEKYVNWIQLDVMDGQFVNNTTWNNPTELKNIQTPADLEVHLMVQNPENVLDQWLVSGVKKIIFHYSATEKQAEIVKRIKDVKLESGLALNPKVDINIVDQFIDQLDYILVMGVNPGFGGQEFLSGTIDKIKRLRAKYPDIDIGADGGINLDTAPQVISAGANFICSGTYIFNSNNIEQTIKQLKCF